MGLMWICFVVTPVRNKVGRFFFLFFNLFLYLSQKPKHLFKENRQSKLLKVIVFKSSHCVKICLQKICSLRCRFTQNWVFLHTLFLENEAQIDQNNLWNDAFHVKTSQSAKKLAQSCKKWKSAKIQYTPFLHKALQLLLNC